MTEIPAVPLPLPEATVPAEPVRMPAEAVIVAVLAWAGSLIAIPAIILFTFVALSLASAFGRSEGFRAGSPEMWVAVVVAALVALMVAADVAAFFLMSGRRWAWWILIVASVVTLPIGFELAVNVLPAAVICVGALAVLVMLFSPNVRAWVRRAR